MNTSFITPIFLATVLVSATMVAGCREKADPEVQSVDKIYDLDRTNPTGTGTNPGGAEEPSTNPRQGNHPGT